MEWNTNQSRLPYHLYTYREELRRRRRREELMKATKTAITDQLIRNNFEEYFKFEQEDAKQEIAELDAPIELEDSAENNSEKIFYNLDCKLSDNEDYEKSNIFDGVSSYTNINWGFGEVMKENKEDVQDAYNFSNLTKNNEHMGMNYNYVDEFCDDFNISFDDGLNDNFETNKNRTNCDLSANLFLEACFSLEEFNYCTNL